MERVRVESRVLRGQEVEEKYQMLIFAIYQSVATLVIIKRTKDAFSLAVSVFQDF